MQGWWIKALIAVASAGICSALVISASSDPLPPGTTYRPLPTRPLSEVKADDEAQKPQVMARQADLLNWRYELANQPIPGVMMSGGRKPVQGGVRVKLPAGVTWDRLAAMTPDEIRQRGLLPEGFMPLPHVKQATGGQVFPDRQIDEIRLKESRDLRRFDVNFDLPDHLTPEFPPPIFLTTQPHLGDVSRGQLLTIKNFYELMNGIVTPVQMEGLRLLLTPFPQEEFNQTEDRKVADQSMGVACLDCHSNFHTNSAFHLTPDIRPQSAGSASIRSACGGYSISRSTARSARCDPLRISLNSSRELSRFMVDTPLGRFGIDSGVGELRQSIVRLFLLGGSLRRRRRPSYRACPPSSSGSRSGRSRSALRLARQRAGRHLAPVLPCTPP